MIAKLGRRTRYDYERIDCELARGLQPREVAELLGVPKDAVYYAVRRRKEQAMDPEGLRYRNPGALLSAIINEYNCVLIEASADGEGFIATLDDCITGPQTISAVEAIRAAAAKAAGR